jgi:hypothetical protein
VWLCPFDDPNVLSLSDAQLVVPPYPALVPVGEDTAGNTVLVDLESWGLTALVGGLAGQRMHLLRAWSNALLSGPHTDIRITAVGFAPMPDAATAHRVREVDTLDQAIASFVSQAEAVHGQLVRAGVESVRAARATETAADTWTPHIILSNEALTEDHLAELTRQVRFLPGAAAAIVSPLAAAVEAGPSPLVLTETAEATSPRLPGAVTLNIPVPPGEAFRAVSEPIL